MLTDLIPSSAPKLVAVLIVAVLAYFLLPLLVSKYPKAPGPAWARITGLWQGYKYYAGNFHSLNIDLHRKHGKIVRLAPNYYSFSDAEATKTIYGHGTKFTKAEWYDAWVSTPELMDSNLFALRSVPQHAASRRRLANMYAMSSLVSYEPFVDKCIALFDDKLRAHAKANKPMDMATWFQFYAFDVIGEITFSKPFGFLLAGHDLDGIISAIDGMTVVLSPAGLLKPIKVMLSLAHSLLGAGAEVGFFNFATAQVQAAKQEHLHGSLDAEERGKAPDFVSKLLAATDGDEDQVKAGYFVDGAVMGNLFAGSDTTSVSLTAIYFNIISRPEVLAKLRAELEAAFAKGELSDPPAFSETHALPYFQAVIKESLRLHPATGLPLWREVPAGGATLAGTYFPEGTNVGVNSWVMHQDRDVYGADASEFRAERWTDSSKEQLKVMNDVFMPFGLGSRTCVGKNVSLLEISKLIPHLLRKYDMSLVNTGAKKTGLSTRGSWFVKQTDFIVAIKERQFH